MYIKGEKPVLFSANSLGLGEMTTLMLCLGYCQENIIPSLSATEHSQLNKAAAG